MPPNLITAFGEFQQAVEIFWPASSIQISSSPLAEAYEKEVLGGIEQTPWTSTDVCLPAFRLSSTELSIIRRSLDELPTTHWLAVYYCKEVNRQIMLIIRVQVQNYLMNQQLQMLTLPLTLIICWSI